LTTHDYQVNGLETQRQQGALTSHYQYDELGRLLEHSARQSSPQTLRRRYEYSQAGNLTSIDDAQRGVTQYHYDPLDRLTSVRGAREESFSHDPAGNLLLDRRTHVVGNKLLLQGDKHYQYDEFGNLIRERRGREQKLVTEYHYDTQHRLIHVTKPDGSEAHYQYDAFGRRIEKQVTDKLGHTEKTEFLWQGDKLIAESSESHYQTYLYEYGSFRPLALITGEGADNAHAYFYHLDQVGTPLEITGHDGAIAWAVDYHAYGNVARERVQEITSPLRFQGQYYDAETGLHYNRHRYYSPETGPYITVDPIGLAGGLNNYQYAKNPTGWVDPLGLSQKPCCGPGGVYTGNTANFKKPDHIPMTQDKFDEIINQERFNRDAPPSYLPDEHIAAHVGRFKEQGATIVQPGSFLDPKSEFKTWPPGKFAGLPEDMEPIISEFKRTGDHQVLNEKLALGLKDEKFKEFTEQPILVIRVAPNDPRFKFEMPTGNEHGAYPGEWVPGGESKGGIREAVLKGAEDIRHNNDIHQLASQFKNSEILGNE
jgi:RHS repeat-associated protein